MTAKIWKWGPILALFGVLAATVVVGDQMLSVAQFHPAYVTGWLLLGMVVMLALFGVRKQVSFLPVGSAANWLQVHIFVGLLSGIVYIVHSEARVPTGWPELLLAVAYLGTFGSGVLGWGLSRGIPPLLSARGQEVIFERIPLYIRQLRDEVEMLVGEANSAENPLTMLYARELRPFFSRPCHVGWHLLQSQRPRQLLLRRVDSCRNRLDADEAERLDRMADLIFVKDDLDYHYALQGILKLWLFVHLPLTYGLLVFSILHVLLVHAFG